MTNLWILTEEKPRVSTIKMILEQYCKDFSNTIIENNDDAHIKPEFDDYFKFMYIFEGVIVNRIDNIYIKLVSGNSSFIDYLIFEQEREPVNIPSDNLLMAIEETKTNDKESRNTHLYQRGIKFVYFNYFYPSVKMYMLYNDDYDEQKNRKPTGTNIFGTNIYLTLGIKIVGRDLTKWYKKFASLNELIEYKDGMIKAHKNNIPITIKKHRDSIELSGRLSKPKNKGNIGYDPNIGSLSIISKCIRHFRYSKPIVITQHGVLQTYITKNKNNKFMYACQIIGMKLKELEMPEIRIPSNYWYYERKSEKIATILLHIVCEYFGIKEIYSNHAGCERTYFRPQNGKPIIIKKKENKGKNKLFLPDIVLYDEKTTEVIVIEGKTLENIEKGIDELKKFDGIENEYIKKAYQRIKISRWLCIYGGNISHIPHEKVLLYLNTAGEVFINDKAPKFIKDAFANKWSHQPEKLIYDM